MPTFFVDTNFFLQCRIPEELPWAEVTDDVHILLLIPRAVQQEVDSHKQSGNSRRAKRARTASSLFRKVIAAPDLKKVIREAAPRVELSFPPLPDPNRERPSHLDLNEPDDRIIEEALAYRTAYPNEDVRLLTHDTNPMLTARHCQLPFVEIPDHWLLQPEPDERAKELTDIRRRLNALEREFPAIAIEVVDESNRILNRLDLEIVTYPDLGAADIDDLVEVARSRHPMAEVFEGHGKPMPQRRSLDHMATLANFGWGRFEPPTDTEIEQYRTQKYPNWLSNIRKKFSQLSRHLESPGRHQMVAFVLRNEGERPAENVIVEVRAVGGLLLAPPADDDGEKTDMKEASLEVPAIPAPPQPPAARFIGGNSELMHAAIFGPDARFRESLAFLPIPRLDRTERDPHSFYWKGGRPMGYSETWTLTCSEFRHKSDPEPFEIVLCVPRDAGPTEAAVIFRVSASNLPEPVSATLPISISYKERDTLAVAHQLIR